MNIRLSSIKDIAELDKIINEFSSSKDEGCTVYNSEGTYGSIERIPVKISSALTALLFASSSSFNVQKLFNENVPSVQKEQQIHIRKLIEETEKNTWYKSIQDIKIIEDRGQNFLQSDSIEAEDINMQRELIASYSRNMKAFIQSGKKKIKL